MPALIAFIFMVGTQLDNPAPELAASCTSAILAENQRIPGFVMFDGCVE